MNVLEGLDFPVGPQREMLRETPGLAAAGAAVLE